MIELSTLQQADTAQTEYLQRIDYALKAYDGRLPAPLKATTSDPGGQDNVQFAWPRIAVDKSAGFLFGDGIDFKVLDKTDPKNPVEQEDVQAQLDQIWDAHNDDILLHEIATNGGIFGDAYVKVWEALPGTPRIVNLNPETVWPFFSVEDYNDVYAWRIQWHGVETHGRDRVIIVRRQVIERSDNRQFWTITDYRQIIRDVPYVTMVNNALQSDRWELMGQITHPYTWSPIVHVQNLPSPNEFWGRADLEEDVVGLAQSASFVMSNIKRIIRHHAHPMPYTVGANLKNFDASIGSMVHLPTGGSMGLLEMGGDLSSSISALDRLGEEFWRAARIPAVALGKVDNLGPQSGVALKVQYQPLLEITHTKERLYGAALNQINRNICEILGVAIADSWEFDVQWPNRLPQDPLSEAHAAVELQSAGVSKRTTLIEMGYDPDEEEKQRTAEADAALEQQAKVFDRGIATQPYGGGRVNGT